MHGEITRDHVDEEILERYALGHIQGSACDSIEEHLLLCDHCQDRLRELDEFIAAFRLAAPEIESSPRRLGIRGFFRDFMTGKRPAYAVAGLVAAGLLVAVIPLRRQDRAPAETITLESFRGESATGGATARTGARPIFNLDLTGLPDHPAFSVEWVDAAGATLWRGDVRRTGDRLAVTPGVNVPGGSSWIRVYEATPPRTLLREYALTGR